MSQFGWGKSRTSKDATLQQAELAQDDLNHEDWEELKRRNMEVPKMQEKFFIHRSAVLTFKQCPYKAYLEYWYKGHGVVGAAIPQHLLIGICVHRGLQHLLEHCRVEHPSGDFSEKCIDDSVMWAHKVYSDVLSTRPLELKKSWNKVTKSFDVEDLTYTVREIHALIEALIRAFAVYRLRDFLEEYEVLEVEKEEVFESFSDIVTWLGKADGLLRRKRDNELVILSFKTAAEFTNSTMFNILIDMQGCSEIVAVEDRLERMWMKVNYAELYWEDAKHDDDFIFTKGLYDYLLGCNSAPKVFANQYEYLVKGKHRADSSEPTKFKYQTHLLHPIKTDSIAVAQLGSGLRFGQRSSEEYEWVTPIGKLPKGKRKIDIVDDIGVKNWIEKLANLEVQPEEGNPFSDIIIGGEERLAKRSLDQLREWRISTQHQAEEIARHVARLHQVQAAIEFHQDSSDEESKKLASQLQEMFQKQLLQFFPRDGKDAQLCYSYYGDKCPFTEHCHNNLHIEDGIESGLWQTREPHHEVEVERFKERRYLK